MPIQENAADFRLISNNVANVFRNEIRERNRFLRGLTSWVGFRATTVWFDAPERAAGKSKYSLAKMLRLALIGIVSFSTAPLRFGIYAGILIGFLSTAYGVYAIAIYFFTDKAVPGWTSLLVLVAFISALQFALIGILGQYVGVIYEETKKRPIYIVSSIVKGSNDTFKPSDVRR